MTDAPAEPRPAEITLEQHGSAAIVTLDRPRALNALTLAMRERLAEWFPRFSRDPQVYAAVLQSSSPKAFSAGSDVREVTHLGRTDRAAACRAFRDEYALNWQIECFSKPTVSLINGMVMGGGVGISLYGTHRVAGEAYKFAMPETMIGLFPDVGVCHAFSRMPDSIGLYLGLTGRTIGRADAYALGLATHCIPASEFEAIKAGLVDTQPVDPLLDNRHQDPGPGDLDRVREVIARCFSAPKVEEIIARLQSESGPNRDWAAAAANDLKARSPLSLAITLRHITEARNLDLRQVLQRDYRLGCHFLEDRDFYEGVRAVVVDKDSKPAWEPSRLEDVTAAMVDRYFAPPASGDWEPPSRSQMQAARA